MNGYRMRCARLPVVVCLFVLLAGATTCWAQEEEGEGVFGWLESSARQVWNQFWKGGNTMWFLLALSVIGLAFTLERAIRLRRKRLAPKGLADRARVLWREGKYGEISRVCDRNDSALGRAIKAILEHRDGTIDDARLIAGDIGSRELRPHYRRVRPLAVVAPTTTSNTSNVHALCLSPNRNPLNPHGMAMPFNLILVYSERCPWVRRYLVRRLYL